METVRDVLPMIRERIVRYQGKGINEMNTKAILIVPMLNALGWDDQDLDQVHREYRYRSSDNPVDYALMDLRTPYLFVEAKALGKNLADHKWASQIMGYASVAGVEWVVLTDGDEYRIYNSHAPVPVGEKLLHTIRVTDDDANVAEILELLSRDGLQKNQLEAHWKAQFVDRQVAKVLAEMFGPEPDKPLVNTLQRRTDNLTRRDVADSLRRVRARFDFPLAPGGAPEPPAAPEVSGTLDVSAKQAKRRRTPQRKRQRTFLRARVKSLVTEGVIQPPLDLHATYKDQQITARVEVDGTVIFREESFSSLSFAAAAARRFVSDMPDASFATNGWTFWRFTDDDGQVKSVDILRQRLLAGSELEGS